MTASDQSCESTATGVRGHRHEAGLTQAQPADRLGTAKSAIARFEPGLHRTGLQSTSRVATAFGCDTATMIQQKRSA